MKILRFLLCHLLSITLLVSCILLFLSRDALKEDFYRLTGRESQPVINDAADISPVIEKKNEISTVAEEPAVVTQHPDDSAVATEASQIPVKTVPVVEPAAVVEPVTIESKRKAENAEEMQAASGAEDEKKSDDPWDTVLAGVKEGQVATSEFGSDIQAEVEPVDERSNAASFPPENYDPESSSSEISGNLESSVASEGFPIMANRGLTAGQTSVYSPQMHENMPVQGLDNTRGSVTDGQLPVDQEYYSALEKARRMHWDGNTTSAQAAFEKLMFEYPTMPEAPADLGNLFLQQGNREGAIWAYQNAIPRYLNLHREQEAINLTRFVSQYDPAIAESLQKKYW